MEQCFASPEIQQRVRDMQEEAKLVLDNESKERVLVGEVISTVALAGQISREKNVSDHGIDMEIEFKDDANEATGELLFLQLSPAIPTCASAGATALRCSRSRTSDTTNTGGARRYP